LKPLAGNKPTKLIAQCHDGTATLSGARYRVQAIVKKNYVNAHFIHCCAHKLNLLPVIWGNFGHAG